MWKRFGLVTALIATALVVGAVVFRPQASLAETTTPPTRTIAVVGQGKLTAKYDTADISLGFSTDRDTPSGAYQDMSAAMNKVVDALKASGVKEDDMKTGTFNLGAQYDWNNGTQKLVGYRSTNTLTVTTQALDKVAALIQTAVDAGANTVNGVSFSIKDTDELLNKALDAAVDDAKAKADRVATRLGAKVVGVMSITVNDQGRPPIMYDRAMESKALMAAPAAAPAPVYSGTGDYSATVSVTFELQ